MVFWSDLDNETEYWLTYSVIVSDIYLVSYHRKKSFIIFYWIFKFDHKTFNYIYAMNTTIEFIFILSNDILTYQKKHFYTHDENSGYSVDRCFRKMQNNVTVILLSSSRIRSKLAKVKFRTTRMSYQKH